MSAPTPAALAAAEEIGETFHLVERAQIAEIIDRHTAPKPVTPDSLGWHREIVNLAESWDKHGATVPRRPLSWESVARMAMDYSKAAIDGKPAPKLPRYFRDESYTYEWDGATMWLNNPREASVMFRGPEDLMSATDAYETDEFGVRLHPQQAGGAA